MVDLTAPAAGGFYMPPEWGPHDCCWLAWPRREAAYRGFLHEARLAYAALCHAIAEFEPVRVAVHPEDEAAARRLLSDAIALFPVPIDDAWVRDSGPTFVVHADGRVAGVDWAFNAWGGKYHPWAEDDALAGRLLDSLGCRRFLAPLVLEGGSIHVDDEGTLLTTEQCLLHPNRNPRLRRPDIEQVLAEFLGVGRFLWLAGDARDTETDGHVDNLACFAGENRVLLMADEADPSLRENHRRLRAAVNAQGGAYDLVLLPRPTVGEGGEDFIASYVNFYFANGGVVLPSFGVAEDARVLAVFRELFPERKAVAVPAFDIVRGGGGIHCVTQQQPSGPARRGGVSR